MSVRSLLYGPVNFMKKGSGTYISRIPVKSPLLLQQPLGVHFSYHFQRPVLLQWPLLLALSSIRFTFSDYRALEVSGCRTSSSNCWWLAAAAPKVTAETAGCSPAAASAAAIPTDVQRSAVALLLAAGTYCLFALNPSF